MLSSGMAVLTGSFRMPLYIHIFINLFTDVKLNHPSKTFSSVCFHHSCTFHLLSQRNWAFDTEESLRPTISRGDSRWQTCDQKELKQLQRQLAYNSYQGTGGRICPFCLQSSTCLPPTMVLFLATLEIILPFSPVWVFLYFTWMPLCKVEKA